MFLCSSLLYVLFGIFIIIWWEISFTSFFLQKKEVGEA